MVTQRTAAVGLLAGVLLLLLAGHGDAKGDASPQTRSSKGGSQCPVDKFDCRNGKCITGSQWCDGIDHCGNNADELSCRICLSGSVKCKSSTQCVLVEARCNGITECQDGSDELGCPKIDEPTLLEELPITAGASGSLLSTSVLLIAIVLYFRHV